jgi:peptidoglycan/LPS O-acetylase OafA/YrhL
MSSKNRLNFEIEVLRAAAILFTLFQHLELLLYENTGLYQKIREEFSFWGGVDLFFCVSGFVITRSLLLNPMPGKTIRENLTLFAIPFWLRRAWRLWPAAWFWVGISVFCSVYLNSTGVFGIPENMLSDSFAALLHYANWHWMGCYNGASVVCNLAPGPTNVSAEKFGWVLAGYWSLSLEEQFYFVLPLLIMLVKLRSLVLLLMLAILFQLGIMRTPLGNLWFFRLDAILVGVLIAYSEKRRVFSTSSSPLVKLRSVGPLLLLVSLATIAWLSADPVFRYQFTTGIIALLCGMLVWLASHELCILWPCRRARTLITWIGSRSYSLYLAHLPTYAVTWEIWKRNYPNEAPDAVAICICALALLVMFSELSFRIIERPFRYYGREWVERFSAERHLRQAL